MMNVAIELRITLVEACKALALLQCIPTRQGSSRFRYFDQKLKFCTTVLTLLIVAFQPQICVSATIDDLNTLTNGKKSEILDFSYTFKESTAVYTDSGSLDIIGSREGEVKGIFKDLDTLPSTYCNMQYLQHDKDGNILRDQVIASVQNAETLAIRFADQNNLIQKTSHAEARQGHPLFGRGDSLTYHPEITPYGFGICYRSPDLSTYFSLFIAMRERLAISENEEFFNVSCMSRSGQIVWEMAIHKGSGLLTDFEAYYFSGSNGTALIQERIAVEIAQQGEGMYFPVFVAHETFDENGILETSRILEASNIELNQGLELSEVSIEALLTGGPSLLANTTETGETATSVLIETGEISLQEFAESQRMQENNANLFSGIRFNNTVTKYLLMGGCLVLAFGLALFARNKLHREDHIVERKWR